MKRKRWAIGQVSRKLRRTTMGFMHWCAACGQMHPLPDTWLFNGDVELPTFAPSFRHALSGDGVCHYTLTAGTLNYHNDCTHAFANQSVPLHDLPPEMCDREN